MKPASPGSSSWIESPSLIPSRPAQRAARAHGIAALGPKDFDERIFLLLGFPPERTLYVVNGDEYAATSAAQRCTTCSLNQRRAARSQACASSSANPRWAGGDDYRDPMPRLDGEGPADFLPP